MVYNVSCWTQHRGGKAYWQIWAMALQQRVINAIALVAQQPWNWLVQMQKPCTLEQMRKKTLQILQNWYRGQGNESAQSRAELDYLRFLAFQVVFNLSPLIHDKSLQLLPKKRDNEIFLKFCPINTSIMQAGSSGGWPEVVPALCDFSHVYTQDVYQNRNRRTTGRVGDVMNGSDLLRYLETLHLSSRLDL